MEGNYDKGLTPFIRFNTEHQTFSTSGGLYYDYIIWGNYEIKENILIANVEDNRHPNFKFEIKNQNTIIHLYHLYQVFQVHLYIYQNH